jgi:hypothetical protein
MSDWQSIRGNAAKLHTDPRNVIFKPASVSAAVLLLKIGTLVNTVWGLYIIGSVAFEEEPFRRHFTGPFFVGSDAFWTFVGLLTLYLGYAGWKTAKGVGEGAAAARYPARTVAHLNVVLGLLAFPWGLFQGIVGLLQAATLNSEGNEQWIKKDVTQHG